MENTKKPKDYFVSDFSNLQFQTAFKQYFSEIGINVKNWDELFREMSEDNSIVAIVRTMDDDVVGFIMYAPIKFSSWFFEGDFGFVREFWIAKKYRNLGYGTELLSLAEKEFQKQNFPVSILTTDTVDDFYIKRGYRKCPDVQAKNKDTVYMKML